MEKSSRSSSSTSSPAQRTFLLLLPRDLRQELASYLTKDLAYISSQLDGFSDIFGRDDIRASRRQLCLWAIKEGNLELLKWARSHHCPWKCTKRITPMRRASAVAARYGHLEILQWIIAQFNLSLLNADLCIEAARGGHLHVLQWLRAQNCPWNDRVDVAALSTDNWELFEWLEKQEPRPRGLYYHRYRNNLMRAQLARGGNLKIIESLFERVAMSEVIASKYLAKGWCGIAASNGHIHVLQWIRSKGVQLDSDAMCSALFENQIETAKWLHAQGIAPPPYAYVGAIKNNRLDIVKWLREKGCPMHSFAFDEAAKIGSVEIMAYLHKEGCEWRPRAIIEASSNGNLETLKWIRNVRGPFSTNRCIYAVQNGHLPVVQWAVEELGMQVDPYEAASRGHLKLFKWLITQNFPWNYKQCRAAAYQGNYLDLIDWMETHRPQNQNHKRNLL